MTVPFLYISADKKYPTAENEVASVLHPPTVFLPENQADYEALSVKLGLKKKSEKKRIPLWHTFSQVAAIALLILTTSIAGFIYIMM